MMTGRTFMCVMITLFNLNWKFVTIVSSSQVFSGERVNSRQKRAGSK